MSHVRRVRARLELSAHRRVAALLDGAYAASVTGRGMELNDLREYVRGDDPKDIDWKASARRGEPLVKRYVAQRRHTVVLAVSTGRSMAAASSVARSKRDVAVEVAGLLGWLAVRQGDSVGAVWGDSAGSHHLPVRSGEPHLERCLTAIHDAVSPDGAPGDLVGLLEHLTRAVRRRAIVLVVGDEDEGGPELTTVLRRLAVQHEVLMLTLGNVDPVAVPAPFPGSRDVDSGRALPAWVRGDALLLAEVEADREQRQASWHAALAGLGIVHEHLGESDAVLPTLRRLLVRQRHARRR